MWHSEPKYTLTEDTPAKQTNLRTKPIVLNWVWCYYRTQVLKQLSCRNLLHSVSLTSRKYKVCMHWGRNGRSGVVSAFCSELKVIGFCPTAWCWLNKSKQASARKILLSNNYHVSMYALRKKWAFRNRFGTVNSKFSVGSSKVGGSQWCSWLPAEII